MRNACAVIYFVVTAPATHLLTPVVAGYPVLDGRKFG